MEEKKNWRERLQKFENVFWKKMRGRIYYDDCETVTIKEGYMIELNGFIQKELDRAREEGYKKGREDQQHLDGLLYGTTVATTTTLEEGWILKDKKKVEEELSKLTTK